MDAGRTRRLSEAEYKATFADPMVDIKGREDLFHPEGVLDLQPYMRAAQADIAPLELLADAPPSSVYLSADRRFEHVLYPCDRSNVYLVVVVVADAFVYGHFVLDLQKEYGLPSSAGPA
jgi:hypothetical protein